MKKKAQTKEKSGERAQKEAKFRSMKEALRMYNAPWWLNKKNDGKEQSTTEMVSHQTNKKTRQYIKKKQAEKEETAGFRNDIHIAAATTWRRRAGHVTRKRANHSRRRTDTMTPFAGEGKKKKQRCRLRWGRASTSATE